MKGETNMVRQTLDDLEDMYDYSLKYRQRRAKAYKEDDEMMHECMEIEQAVSQQPLLKRFLFKYALRKQERQYKHDPYLVHLPHIMHQNMNCAYEYMIKR